MCDARSWLRCLVLVLVTCVAPHASAVWGQADAGGSKVAADAADQAGDQSTPEATQAYTQAATFQNNAAYDLAAEAWQTYLKNHPQDARVVEAQYNLGVCLLEQKRLGDARDVLAKCVKSGREFDRREDAYLNWGWSIYMLAMQDKPQLFADATVAFDEMLETFPKGKHRDQALFLRGESLYLQEDREAAVKSYQQLVDDGAKSELRSNALYALGVTREELGQYEASGKAYEQFLDEFADHSLAAEVRMRHAETLLQRGDLSAAEKGFAEAAAVSGFADADYASYRQAYALARQERFAEAAKLFGAIVSRYPKSRYVHDATMAAARAYYRAEQLDPAKEWLDRLLDREDADGSEATHWRARLMLKEKQFDQARELVERRLPLAEQQQHPFFVNLRMDQADIYYEIPEQRAPSIDLYLRVTRDFADHPLAAQSLYNAAFAAMEEKKYQQAVTLSDDFLKRFSDHRLAADAKQVRAESQLQLGETGEAVNSFEDLARQDPKTAAKWQLRKAVAMYARQDYQNVLDELTPRLSSMTTKDEQAEAYYLIGMSSLGQQDYQAARTALAKSIDAQPAWRQADQTLLSLSRVQHKLGQTAEAKTTVERLLTDFPASELLDRAHFRLGEYRYASGDYDEATHAYDKVIATWPTSDFVPYSLYGRGWALLRKREYPGADATFSKLLDDYADHDLATQTWYARAMTRQQAGSYAASIKDVDAFLAKNQDPQQSTDALYVKGLSLVGLQAYDDAIPVLLTALKDSDGRATDKILYELAWAYKSTGNTEQATESFRQLATQHPDSSLTAESYYHVGEAAYGSQDYASATAAYAQAESRLKPGDELGEKVLYKLGWSQYQQKQDQAAIAAFAKQAAQYPNGPLVGDAYFMQAECHFRQQEHQQALVKYADAQKRQLSSEQITTLTYLHAGQAAAQLNRWQLSHDWLAALQKKYPKSAFRNQVDFEMAVAQQNLDKPDEAERLFGKVAEAEAGELAARARFMVGEVLYAKREYARAIKEFRKVMYGFDATTTPEIGKWQAKAGFEAGQCAGIVASQQQDRQQREKFVNLARKYFQYVVARFPDGEEARAAVEQLKKYGA